MIFKFLTVVICCTALVACSTLPFMKETPRENLYAKQDPYFNFTHASEVLACVGHEIDKSPLAPLDIIVAGVRDQTKPIEVPGLLATDNTMMTTVAMDRLGTDKVAVIGSSGAIKGRDVYQLVGAFTELNRTLNSRALGAGATVGNLEFDLGSDKEWNHIALDLGLTKNSRLVKGLTVSVSISLKNDSLDGNLSVSPGSDNAGVIAVGFRSKEGIHAAQRLLIETALAVLTAKLYEIDPSPCFKKVYQHKANFETQKSIPEMYQQNTEKPPLAPVLTSAVVDNNIPQPVAQKLATVKNNQSDCQVAVEQLAGLQAVDEYSWQGGCDASNFAEGKGILKIYAGHKLRYQYAGEMQAGQMHGQGVLKAADGGFAYQGTFERGLASGDGYVDTPHGRYKADYSSESRTLMREGAVQ